MMSKNYSSSTFMISRFIIAALIIFIINAAINTFLLDDYKLTYWWLNYVFLVPVTVIGLYFVPLKYRKTHRPTSIGKGFVVYTAVKMILSILFLLPWLLNKDPSSKPMVIQFFSIFFPFLLVETILLVRLLNVELGEKNEKGKNQQ
ncbi:MAG: hypothetical protein WDZ35_01790 [Crocinitomicaceae bacterium]